MPRAQRQSESSPESVGDLAARPRDVCNASTYLGVRSSATAKENRQ